VTGDTTRPTAPRLTLTDFLDGDMLQEVQDSFTAIAGVRTTFLDADGRPVTVPTDTRRRVEGDLAFKQLIDADEDIAGDGRFTAPIVVEGQALGSIVIERKADATPVNEAMEQRLRGLATRLGIDDPSLRDLLDAATDSGDGSREARAASSIQFLFILANAIARLCYDQYHSRQRVRELSALYRVSTELAGNRDLGQVLDTAARAAADVMQVRGVTIRLIERDEQKREVLRLRAVHGLSERYIRKGDPMLDESPIFREALAGQVVHIADMIEDGRVVYPVDADAEGLVSMLCVGLVYRGRHIGTLQLFTDERRHFTEFEVNLIRAIAQLLATAIENARLDAERNANRQVIRQLHLAADVQRRMLPAETPRLAGFDIAARYVPSYELGGDFYDFIDLGDNLGITIGDVVGKGIAASLLMASVRASVRAYAQDVYDLDEIIARVNVALSRDTLPNEFATIWYGTIDPRTGRLTYCNAGHEPPLLLRDGEVFALDTGGMIVGVDPDESYEKGLWDLHPGDLLLLYTDGLPDAMDDQGRRFGRDVQERLLRECRGMHAHAALDHILKAQRKHTGSRRPHDDTTLVVVRVTGSFSPAATLD